MLPIVWNMCGNLQYESVYFKELHKDQDTIDRQHREGAAVVSRLLVANEATELRSEVASAAVS